MLVPVRTCVALCRRNSVDMLNTIKNMLAVSINLSLIHFIERILFLAFRFEYHISMKVLLTVLNSTDVHCTVLTLSGRQVLLLMQMQILMDVKEVKMMNIVTRKWSERPISCWGLYAIYCQLLVLLSGL